MGKNIYYTKGYKYQLERDYQNKVKIYPKESINTEYICLSKAGDLFIKHGYAWDGGTGVKDTKTILRGSLGHDAICQLMRMGKLPREWRIPNDKEFIRVCKEDKMKWFRRWYIKRGVTAFGKFATDPKNKRKILVSP